MKVAPAAALRALVSLTALVWAACADETDPLRVTPGVPVLEDASGSAYAPRADGRLHVWFFDVGHGDAALIQSPTGRTVLVDSGPASAGSRLSARLPELLDGPVDLLLLTHAADEHHAGLIRLVRTVGVRQILLPAAPDPRNPSPDRFASVGALSSARAVPLFVARDAQETQEAQRLDLGGGASLVLLPVRLGHETSLAALLRHGETSILFAPDATEDAERALVSARPDLRATLLKVPSHAEDGATSNELLAAVKPELAIVSVGAGNARGAPSRPVLARLSRQGAEVFRTDLDGELHVEGDGRRLILRKERPAVGESREARFTFGAPPLPPAVKPQPIAEAVPAAAPVAAIAPAPTATPAPVAPKPKAKPRPPPAPKPAPQKIVAKAPPPANVQPAAVTDAPSLRVAKGAYVASRNSEVFHVPDCRNALKILERNLVVYRSRKDAEKERRPAGDCNP